MKALLDDKLNADARGRVGLQDVERQNIILIFGCKSGTGIGASSVMAEDFVKALLSSCKEDFTCQLSDVLDALKGTDVNFEIVKAQTVRPLKLEYVHNKFRILKAYIFGWTELNDFAKWEKI